MFDIGGNLSPTAGWIEDGGAGSAFRQASRRSEKSRLETEEEKRDISVALISNMRRVWISPEELY